MSYAGGVHNTNYVCTTCRTVRRLSFRTETCKCPECGEFMEWAGHKIRVPKKHQKAEWKKLIQLFRLREPKPVVSKPANRK